MAVCNLFKKLTNSTGTFLTFSQYLEDLTKENGTNGTYHITPSKFIALDIKYGKIPGYVESGDLNIDVPRYLQNYFENGCAYVKANLSNWNPKYSANLFWRSLFDAGWLSITRYNSLQIVDEFQYIGDINIQNYSNIDGIGYSELFCHIPNDAKKNRYGVKIETGADEFFETQEGYIQGYNQNTENGLDFRVKKYQHKYQQKYIFDTIDNDSIGKEIDNETQFNINTVIVLYDIKKFNLSKNEYTTIYQNIPMGIYFTGLINSNGSVQNQITKYVSNEDIFDCGTSYGLRICSRFSNNNGDLSINVEDNNYNEIGYLLSEMSKTLNSANEIINQNLNYQQSNKELLSIFKNSRTNVPYIKVIGDIPYWFVNGKNTYIEANSGIGGNPGGGGNECDYIIITKKEIQNLFSFTDNPDNPDNPDDPDNPDNPDDPDNPDNPDDPDNPDNPDNPVDPDKVVDYPELNIDKTHNQVTITFTQDEEKVESYNIQLTNTGTGQVHNTPSQVIVNGNIKTVIYDNLSAANEYVIEFKMNLKDGYQTSDGSSSKETIIKTLSEEESLNLIPVYYPEFEISVTGTTIDVECQNQDGVDSYILWLTDSSNNNIEYNQITGSQYTKLSASNLSKNQTYQFNCRMNFKDGYKLADGLDTTYSKQIQTKDEITIIQYPQIETSSTTDTIYIQWPKVVGAKEYKLELYKGDELISNQPTLNFNNALYIAKFEGLDPNTTYKAIFSIEPDNGFELEKESIQTEIVTQPVIDSNIYKIGYLTNSSEIDGQSTKADDQQTIEYEIPEHNEQIKFFITYPMTWGFLDSIETENANNLLQEPKNISLNQINGFEIYVDTLKDENGQIIPCYRYQSQYFSQYPAGDTIYYKWQKN